MAYVAAIIDTHAIIRTRLAPGTETELPFVGVHGPNVGMLAFLAGLTGTKVTTVRRQYMKAGCAEHCKEKHQHIQSVSGRWSVSGVKATVLLFNVRPYIRLQGDDLRYALDVGLRAGYKASTVTKMTALGWDAPEFDNQYRRQG